MTVRTKTICPLAFDLGAYKKNKASIIYDGTNYQLRIKSQLQVWRTLRDGYRKLPYVVGLLKLRCIHMYEN
jgi:hypothetical protein